MFRLTKASLLLALFYVCYLRCDVSAEHCSRKQWLLARVETFYCPHSNMGPDHEFCCGSILQRTCCTLQEKRLDDERYASTSKAILSVIVTGISLIFVGFTIGWIYSCYLITRAPEEIPEIDANGRPVNGDYEANIERPFLLTIFGRFLNLGGLDYSRTSDHRNPIYSISPLNDKPPSYSSLFVCDRNCSTAGCMSPNSRGPLSVKCDPGPSNHFHRPGTAVRVSNMTGNRHRQDARFGEDELPPPSYSHAIRLSDYRN